MEVHITISQLRTGKQPKQANLGWHKLRLHLPPSTHLPICLRMHTSTQLILGITLMLRLTRKPMPWHAIRLREVVLDMLATTQVQIMVRMTSPTITGYPNGVPYCTGYPSRL
jgi:hypothetical protein